MVDIFDVIRPTTGERTPVPSHRARRNPGPCSFRDTVSVLRLILLLATTFGSRILSVYVGFSYVIRGEHNC